MYPDALMSGGRLRYLPALDGVRAFAVLAVLAYHGGQTWAAGGFLGVDAFFVLSGFLITSLLLAERRQSGRIDLRAFWMRRARRLLPALFLVLGAVAVYAAAVAAPTELERIRADGLGSLFYVANWRFVFAHQSYFEQFAVPSPLRHMWSLAIEEQFYLLWPLFVFGLLHWGKGSTRKLALATGALAATSLTLMIVLYSPGGDPSRVYYGTDTRATSLLVGALLAMLVARRPFGKTATERNVLHGAAVASALVLGWWWATTPDRSDWLYNGGLFAAAVLVAVVIADASQEQQGPLGWLLSLRPLRWMGAISYGLYLWHWPIYVYLNPQRVEADGFSLFAIRVAVTFVVATASYYLVEQPIRTGSWRRIRVRIAAPVSVAILVAALVVSTLGAVAPPTEVSASDLAPPSSSPTATPSVDAPPRILLVGDSVANSLAAGLELQAAAHGFEFWNAAIPGCGLATEEGERLVANQWVGPYTKCEPTWRQRWPDQVELWQPDVVVMMLGAQETYDRRIGSRVIYFDTPEGAALRRATLERAVSEIERHGARVVLLTALYGKLGWPLQIDQSRSGFNDAWIDAWNRAVVEVAAADPSRRTLLDLNAYLDPEGRWAETVHGVRARTDGVHLTVEAADIAARWLVPQILATLPADEQTPTAPPSSRRAPRPGS